MSVKTSSVSERVGVYLYLTSIKGYTQKGKRDMNHKRLYVGDLPKSATEGQIKSLFTEVGSVDSIALMHNASIQRFAFVEMSTPEAAREAVKRYNGYDLDGSRLIVYAVPPKSRPREVVR